MIKRMFFVLGFLATIVALWTIFSSLGASIANAGPKYHITLQSGATYTIDKVTVDTYQVETSLGQLVGYLKLGRSGGNIDVLDEQNNLLDSANRINPDALEILDAKRGDQ